MRMSERRSCVEIFIGMVSLVCTNCWRCRKRTFVFFARTLALALAADASVDMWESFGFQSQLIDESSQSAELHATVC